MVSRENDGSAVELLKSAGSAFGRFQLVNHGIPRDLIAAGDAAATAAFRIPSEKKAAAARSPERRWGFEVEEEEGVEGLFGYRSEMGEVLAGIGPKATRILGILV
ncbi:putative Flavonol synthase/flavanone 3-hydroxylase [Cocos nucifera]|uniref:Putative Flavonol synthase/flavanone 3-hydroxylase n=1 Tax=Cocos nucifera TaxID=13894 RepID=A0A8K0IVV4_COCNU|nr:putative Flavonol synthase/flavanone 3-hydroxylase [Cocos nucifera]